MTTFDRIAAAIDATLAEPDDAERVARAVALMTTAADLPGGLDALVTRYGDCDDPQVLRPLTFVLAGTLARSHARVGAAQTLVLVGRLRTADEPARANLATALHLTAMYRALPESIPTGPIAAFLTEALRGGPLLHEPALPALAAVLAAGIRFAGPDRRALRAAVTPFRDSDPEWARAALDHLADESPPA